MIFQYGEESLTRKNSKPRKKIRYFNKLLNKAKDNKKKFTNIIEQGYSLAQINVITLKCNLIITTISISRLCINTI